MTGKDMLIYTTQLIVTACVCVCVIIQNTQGKSLKQSQEESNLATAVCQEKW